MARNGGLRTEPGASLMEDRDHELIQEMASLIEARWRESGTNILDGLVERLTAEEEMKKRASYTRHALLGAAYTARMFWENPDLSEDAKKFGQWAEEEFLRISRGEVGERDLIG